MFSTICAEHAAGFMAFMTRTAATVATASAGSARSGRSAPPGRRKWTTPLWQSQRSPSDSHPWRYERLPKAQSENPAHGRNWIGIGTERAQLLTDRTRVLRNISDETHSQSVLVVFYKSQHLEVHLPLLVECDYVHVDAEKAGRRERGSRCPESIQDRFSRRNLFAPNSIREAPETTSSGQGQLTIAARVALDPHRRFEKAIV